MVEGRWPNTTQKACVSFNVHNDRRSLLNTDGVWGAVSPPPSGSRVESWWGCRERSPGSSKNLAFYSTGKEAYNRAKNSHIIVHFYQSCEYL